MSKELVIHPDHYNKEGRKECWDEMLEIFGPNAVAIFDLLSAYKYLYRAGEKDGNPAEQDQAKIDNYIQHAANLICTNERMSAARKCYINMQEVLSDE